MDDALLTAVLRRLDASPLEGGSEELLLGALESDEALSDVLGGRPRPRPARPAAAEGQDDVDAARAYLRSVTVEGFRGVGPAATLNLEPGPGLTVVCGRNGSGKSTFAEALEAQPEAKGARVGYFGASTGAAAALWSAAQAGSAIAAVVSRGGRPDLASPRLADVRSPTLLIVGGRDEVVLELNRDARAGLGCLSRLAVVAGATHLLEEPGALEEVGRLAADWFGGHLAPSARPFS
jgi:pimeloyl-ACP methyl ester carboxylesterase